jgi:exopolysaccharide biosynthesis polyprenyl glycosylphosphotransferase
MLLDGAWVLLSLALAVYLRPLLVTLPIFDRFSGLLETPNWSSYFLLLLVWLSTYFSFRLYDAHKFIFFIDELLGLITANVMAVLIASGIFYLLNLFLPRFLLMIFFTTVFAGHLGFRVLFRAYWHFNPYKDQRQQHVLILGAGPLGRQLAKEINSLDTRKINLLGYLDDNPNLIRSGQALGDLGEVRKWVQRYDITDVVITLPNTAYKRITEVIRLLDTLPVQVWVVPDLLALSIYQKAALHKMGDFPMINLRSSALTDTQRTLKRLLDLALLGLLSPPLLPLIGLLALIIRFDSPGCPFFVQTRVGENGCLFKMIKFRTMVENAVDLRHLVEHTNQDNQFIHKVRDDPRVTQVGSFLRRWSLDEIPQIFNVLKGDMSFVGPRPEMPHLVKKYDLWQRRRFAIPQGITGWWQINGRSDLPMHLNTELDLYYIDHYSIWLDLRILLKTVWAVLSRKGAF